MKTLLDLKGKRVSVGPKQSGTELNARAIFAAAGMTYADFGRTDYLPFGQSAKMIEKGELDATLQSAGLGVEFDPPSIDGRADPAGCDTKGHGDRKSAMPLTCLRLFRLAHMRASRSRSRPRRW